VIAYGTRKWADSVFYEAMRVLGVSRWKAVLMWAGVRLGGVGAYKT